METSCGSPPPKKFSYLHQLARLCWLLFGVCTEFSCQKVKLWLLDTIQKLFWKNKQTKKQKKTKKNWKSWVPGKCPSFAWQCPLSYCLIYIIELFNSSKWQLLSHPPYGPDLAHNPLRLICFQNWKKGSLETNMRAGRLWFQFESVPQQ